MGNIGVSFLITDVSYLNLTEKMAQIIYAFNKDLIGAPPSFCSYVQLAVSISLG